MDENIIENIDSNNNSNNNSIINIKNEIEKFDTTKDYKYKYKKYFCNNCKIAGRDNFRILRIESRKLFFNKLGRAVNKETDVFEEIAKCKMCKRENRFFILFNNK